MEGDHEREVHRAACGPRDPDLDLPRARGIQDARGHEVVVRVRALEGHRDPRAVAALEDMRGKIEKVYGPCSDKHEVMNVLESKGQLETIVRFVKE